MTALALIALLAPQDEPDWLGRTAEGVVAMGRDRFFREFTEKHGESTMAMAGAESAYGDAVHFVNERTLAGKPQERHFVERLRVETTAGRNAAIECARSLTGGGTMWVPVSAAVQTEVESMVYELLTGRPGAGATQKSAWDAIAKARADLLAAADEIDGMAGISGVTSSRALASADDLSNRLFASARLVAARPEGERRRVFRFFRNAAEMVSELGAE